MLPLPDVRQLSIRLRIMSELFPPSQGTTLRSPDVIGDEVAAWW